MLKLYDIRKFQSFIQPYYYNILEESYYPKAKMEQYNAGIFNRKRKKYKPKDTFQLCSFNCISSLILKEERLKEKYTLSRFNAPVIQYSKFGLGEELSEDMTALSNTNEESVAAIREAEQIKAIQEKIKAYYSTLVKGNTSLQIDSNGQYLLVCSVDGNLYMYSLKHLDLCPPKIYKSQKASYYSKAEICPSGDLIGSANAEGKVVLWDSQSGDILKVYDDMYAHELNGFSWMHSPQHIFAAGGDEGIVAIYK
jgi:WD40 repeat protein